MPLTKSWTEYEYTTKWENSVEKLYVTVYQLDYKKFLGFFKWHNKIFLNSAYTEKQSLEKTVNKIIEENTTVIIGFAFVSEAPQKSHINLLIFALYFSFKRNTSFCI